MCGLSADAGRERACKGIMLETNFPAAVRFRPATPFAAARTPSPRSGGGWPWAKAGCWRVADSATATFLLSLDSSTFSPYAVAQADLRPSVGPPAFHEIPDPAKRAGTDEVRIEMRLKSPATRE